MTCAVVDRPQVSGVANVNYRLIFVCDGVFSSETPLIRVTSTVAVVAFQKSPEVLPYFAYSRKCVCCSSCVFDQRRCDDAGVSFVGVVRLPSTATVNSASLAVLKVLDANGKGIVGK